MIIRSQPVSGLQWHRGDTGALDSATLLALAYKSTDDFLLRRAWQILQSERKPPFCSAEITALEGLAPKQVIRRRAPADQLKSGCQHSIGAP